MKEIALIDNYDSFTYNLVHLLEKVSDVSVKVFLNNRVSIAELKSFRNIVLSPGPGLPSEAGIMPSFLKTEYSRHRILGVCLGMQAIGECFGSVLHNLEDVYHGLATPVFHSGEDYLFRGVPQQFLAGRYHSWVIGRQQLSETLEVIARDEHGEIMAIRHRQHDIRGLQFHPESVLSEYGETILKNWIEHEAS